jgi:rRNA maturation endonuclease Nob1
LLRCAPDSVRCSRGLRLKNSKGGVHVGEKINYFTICYDCGKTFTAVTTRNNLDYAHKCEKCRVDKYCELRRLLSWKVK